MRVYTFQDTRFVKEWFTVFDCIDNTVTQDNIDCFCCWSHSIGESKRPIYNGKDFIYTFYKREWQNNRTFLKQDIFKLIMNYTSGFRDKEGISLIELEVPDDVGLFGYLDESFNNQRLLTKQEAYASNDFCEYVLPFIKNEWIVEIYDLLKGFYKGIPICLRDGFYYKKWNLSSDNVLLTNNCIVYKSLKNTILDYQLSLNECY